MTSTHPSSKSMHITLWILQVLLGAMYLMAGGNKLSQSIEELSKMLPWVTEVPSALVRFIGLSEVLGALGLILPSLFRIKPNLTVWAGGGLALVQLFAAIFHFSRGEMAMIGMNILFMAMALFIAWGRTKKAPITSK